MSASSEHPAGADVVQARRRRRLWQLGGALVLAAAVVAAIALSSGGDPTKPPLLRAGEVLPGQTEAAALFAEIPQQGITIGDPQAPATLVEFADLQCPFCREYTVNVMPTLVANYVKTGKLKMVFRNVAFIGADSQRAAQMAAAAGMQNKLWEYVDVFYNNQGEENSGYATDAFLRKVGRAVKGLDVARAMGERDLPAVAKELRAAEAAAHTAQITGTPSFLIGPSNGSLTLMPSNVSPTVNEISDRIDAALQAG